MKYDEFKNNDYLQRMVDELNRDGIGSCTLRYGTLRI